MPKVTTSSASSANVTITRLPGSKGPKKPKQKRWLPAFMQELEDTARGVFPGLAVLAKATYNDVDRIGFDLLPGNRAKSFQWDDIGDAVVEDYKQRYGSWDQFKEGVATRPLSFLLDVGTVATLGAGLLVTAPAKLTVAAARTGKAGASTAGQSSRLLRMAGFVARTPETEADAAAVYGKNSRAFHAGKELGVVRDVRRVGGQAVREGRFANVSSAGEATLLKPRRMNPLLARRDEVVRSGIDRLPRDLAMKAPVVGTAAARARQDRRKPALAADVRRMAMLREPAKRLQSLDGAEQVAWFFRHTGSDPVAYAAHLRRTADEAEMGGHDRAILEETLKRITDDDVLEAYRAPSQKVVNATRATKKLADEDMADLLRGFGFSDFDLLERRLLQERIVEGATSTRSHPEATVTAAGAARAAREAERAANQRQRTADQVASAADRAELRAMVPDRRMLGQADVLQQRAAATLEKPGRIERTARERAGREERVPLERMSAREREAAGEVVAPAVGSARAARMLEAARLRRERLAEHLRDVALSMRERVTTQRTARQELRNPRGRLQERSLSAEEAVKQAPDRVEWVPEPGEAPSPEQAELILKGMRNRLMRGRQYAGARVALRNWIAELYNEARYRTANPTSAHYQAERAAQRDVRDREARKKRGNEGSHGELMGIMDRHGVWSRQAATYADAAGPMRDMLVRAVKRSRGGGTGDRRRELPAYPTGSLEEALVGQGIHPEDPLANFPDDDAIAETIESWLEEKTAGAATIAEIARGVRSLDGGEIDQASAQDWVALTRSLNPEAGLDPSNSDVAWALAQELMPRSERVSLPDKVEFVDDLMHAMLRIFEDGDEAVTRSELLGPSEDVVGRLLEERLGIRDDEAGKLPSGAERAEAIQELAEQAGFDADYREAAVGLRWMERRYAEEGPAVFREERFVPDPAQTDFGTVLEFLPDLPAEVRRKLVEDAGSLTAKERSTVTRAAAELERAAGKLDKPTPAEVELRRVADQVDVVDVEEPIVRQSPEAARWQTAADRLQSQREAAATRMAREAARLRERAGNNKAALARAEAMREKAERLRTTPSRREKQLLERAARTKPAPLKGLRREPVEDWGRIEEELAEQFVREGMDPEEAAAAARSDVMVARADEEPRGYREQELVNPQTERLYIDEDAELVAEDGIEALEQRAEGASYFPHIPPKDRSFGTTARSTAAVKGEPKLPGNLAHINTGRRFSTGTFSMDPMQLLETATRLIRSRQARDLYEAGVAAGVPFDVDVYHRTGGSREWAVLDKTRLNGFSRQLAEADAQVSELEGLMDTSEFTSFVETVMDNMADSDRLARAGNREGIVMVPRAYYDRLTGDLATSSKAVQVLIDKPLAVFRSLVLFIRPAYYVNNIVGQTFIGAVKDGGPMFLPRYVAFLAAKGREDAARRLYGEVVNDRRTNMALWNTVLDRHAKELLGASFYDTDIRPGQTSWLAYQRMHGGSTKRKVAWLLQAPDGAARLGAILSDDLPRQYHFMRLLAPEIKDARARGMEGSDPEIANELLEDEVLRDRLIDETLADLIDYRAMSPFERTKVRRVIPFYGWLRGIGEWTVRLGYNEPGKAWTLAQIGQLGMRENEDWNEQVPSYLRGAIRIPGADGGMQRVIGTQGLNPLGTVADLTLVARGALSGDPRASLSGGSFVGQINPYARAFLQASLNEGKDFSTDLPMGTPWSTLNRAGSEAPVPGGWIGAGTLGFAGGLPVPMLYRRQRTIEQNMAQYGTPGTPTSINNSPFSHYVAGFAGLPVRDVNVAAARARLAREQAILNGEGF